MQIMNHVEVKGGYFSQERRKQTARESLDLDRVTEE